MKNIISENRKTMMNMLFIRVLSLIAILSLALSLTFLFKANFIAALFCVIVSGISWYIFNKILEKD